MPDLVLYNGQLHTQDPQFPQATALALRGNRILAVGQDDEILALGDGRAPTINLAGRRVLPGLIDSHFHLYQWALLMRGVQLADSGSLDQVRERVGRAVTAARPGEWILGRGWNQTEWPHPVLPLLSRSCPVPPPLVGTRPSGPIRSCPAAPTWMTSPLTTR